MSSLVIRGGRASAAVTVPTAASKSSAKTASIISSRCLSSSPAHSRQRIPPESPLFINIPNPPQDQSVEERRALKPVRGHLPLPRQVFKHRDAFKKPTDEFLQKAAPEPTSEKSQQPPLSEKQAWKRRMAASRRENMKSGVRDLWDRKVTEDRRRSTTQSRKLAINRALAMAPMPEDERLTMATTVNAASTITAVAPDPLRFERALASRARTEQIAAAKSERRRDAVQDLYMSAHTFIVDEEDLINEVEKQFAPDFYSKNGKHHSGRPIRNVRDLQGEPKSMMEMLKSLMGSSKSLVDQHTTDATRSQKRQQRLAEELTGGRMDDMTYSGNAEGEDFSQFFNDEPRPPQA